MNEEQCKNDEENGRLVRFQKHSRGRSQYSQWICERAVYELTRSTALVMSTEVLSYLQRDDEGVAFDLPSIVAQKKNVHTTGWL